MKLFNAMEHAVRGHLKWVREQSPLRDEACWCPLCRADMMALALTALPPRYATRLAKSLPEGETHDGKGVRDEVVHAVRHVASFPKHPHGAAVAAGQPVWVVNFPLEESFRAVDALLRSNSEACDCWNCRCDIVAFALNRYPTRYGVEHLGQTNLLDGEREQIRSELASFLDLALRVVSTVPRHAFQTAGA